MGDEYTNVRRVVDEVKHGTLVFSSQPLSKLSGAEVNVDEVGEV